MIVRWPMLLVVLGGMPAQQAPIVPAAPNPAARTAASGNPAAGFAVVTLAPLPTRFVRDRSGRRVEVEAVDETTGGSWSVDFNVHRWIEPPAGRAADEIDRPIRRSFERDESTLDPTQRVQFLKGQVFLIEVTRAPDGRGLQGDRIWWLGQADPALAARSEVNGWDTLRPIRVLPDDAARARALVELAAEPRGSSVLLILELQHLLRADSPDDRRLDVIRALMDILLRRETPPAVAREAWIAVEPLRLADPRRNQQAQVFVARRLLDAYHEVANAPDVDLDRTVWLLETIQRYLPRLQNDPPRVGVRSLPLTSVDLPLARLAADLEQTQARLEPPIPQIRSPQGNRAFELIAAIRALLPAPARP